MGMNFFLKKKCSYKDKTIHPLSLSTLSRSIYKATSTYNIPPNIISDSFLFVCERLTISTVMDKSVICFILLLLPMLYIIIIFCFFTQKLLFFCGYQAAPSFAPNIQRLIK